MADDLKISLGVELNEGDFQSVQSKIDSLKNGKNSEIKLQLSKNINAEITNLQKQLHGLTSQVYTIKLQIDQSAISSIQNLTNSLNQAVANTRSTISQNLNAQGAGKSNNGYIGVSKVIERGTINEWGQFEASTEIEKRNLALGETLTIYKQLKKEEGDLQGTMEETSRQYETNYEAQAKAREKAEKEETEARRKSYLRDLKENSKQMEYERQQKIKAEKEANDYERKEQDRLAREESKRIEARAREEAAAAKKRATDTSMYAGMFDQIEKAEKAAADYNIKYLSDQSIKYSDLQSKAFSQNNPLTGDFKAKADEAIAYWKSKIDEAKSYSGKLTTEQESAIREAEAAAKRTVIEQQKAQWRGDKLAAKDVGQKVSNAKWGLDIQAEELKQAGQYSDEAKQKIESLRQALDSVKDQKGFDEWSKQLQQFNQELELSGEKAKTAFKSESMQLDLENLQTRLNNLKQKYDEFVQANPDKANSGIEQSFERISEAINKIDTNNIDPQKIALLRKEVRNFGSDVSNIVTPSQSLSQILSQNFGGLGQYLARFTSSFYLISKGISTIKSMVSEVTSLDSSLMELQKVTTLSGESLTQFTDSAYKTGKEVGRTGKDVIDAVTTFSRAGYDLQESNELAKSALVMTNVGVDIPNTEAAASDMISILKAYNKQASESMQVVDELYNVANKEPLDFGNITSMLVTAGGTLAQTNTSLEESMGLLTGAYATLRDNSVANG